MGHLAAFDPRRQLPRDAVKRAAPAGDGPGRTVALVPIWGTVQRAVKWGWPAVEGVLRLRLVAGIAPGAEWGALQPGRRRSGPPGPAGGTVGHLAAFDPRRQLPGDAAKWLHRPAIVRAASWPWRPSH